MNFSLLCCIAKKNDKEYERIAYAHGLTYTIVLYLVYTIQQTSSKLPANFQQMCSYSKYTC